jgi:hypothetical protein
MVRTMAAIPHARTSLRITALLFIASAVLAVSGWADDTPEERATLRGIKAVRLVVWDLHPDAEADGLTAGQLRSDVEGRLRKAGIAMSQSAKTFLNVTVNTSGRENGWYFCVIEVNIAQRVALVRDRKTIIVVATWRIGNFGGVSAPELSRYVRGTVADQVEMFIRAYREQNPKP